VKRPCQCPLVNQRITVDVSTWQTLAQAFQVISSACGTRSTLHTSLCVSVLVIANWFDFYIIAPARWFILRGWFTTPTHVDAIVNLTCQLNPNPNPLFTIFHRPSIVSVWTLPHWLVLSCPCQQVSVPLPSRYSAEEALVPRAWGILVPHPLQHLQMPFLAREMAGHHAPRTWRELLT